MLNVMKKSLTVITSAMNWNCLLRALFNSVRLVIEIWRPADPWKAHNEKSFFHVLSLALAHLLDELTSLMSSSCLPKSLAYTPRGHYQRHEL